VSTSLAYQILKLRVDVFVVEQECAYPELDGRDLEPTARWWWVVDQGRVIATLRVLADPDGWLRIGRVATAPEARSGGVASTLMRTALAELGSDSPVRLDAQAPLEGWYGRFGFARSGANFVEDGIAHVPMRRTSAAG
jgi:ElaA protein